MIRTTTVMGNIEAQEGLVKMMRSFLDIAGKEKVAERLGISVDELEDRMDHFTDMTLTELRYLAHSMDVSMTFQVCLNGTFPITEVDSNV